MEYLFPYQCQRDCKKKISKLAFQIQYHEWKMKRKKGNNENVYTFFLNRTQKDPKKVTIK